MQKHETVPFTRVNVAALVGGERLFGNNPEVIKELLSHNYRSLFLKKKVQILLQKDPVLNLDVLYYIDRICKTQTHIKLPGA